MFISFFGGVTPAYAASSAVSGFNDTTQLNVPKNGGITPVKLDDDVTLTSSGSFSDGYLLFKNTGPAVSGDMLSILSDSNPNAYGAISLVGSTIYLGNGGGRESIGTVDGTLNGENGKDLKILFSAQLPNGGFEASSSNWTQTNSIIRLSGDSTTSSTPSTTIEVKTKSPYFNWNWVDTVDGSTSYMRLYLSTWINNPFGALHGPKITSKAFSASQGDHVSLYYYAKNTGDKYDVYGYLTDTTTGRQQQLFYQRGDQTDGWQSVSAEITLPDSDSFVFEFLCGSQDGTGGRYISSELLIDNVRVVSDLVSSQVATNIARRVALVSASQDTRTSTEDRTYKLTAVDSLGSSYTSVTSATVRVHTYPATPVVTGMPKAGTTDAIDGAWSAADADTYDVWVNGAQVFGGTTATAGTMTGLSPNQARTLTVVGTNDMGDSNSSARVLYSSAAVPSLAVDSSSISSITLGINNNSNPGETAYCLERSSDGTNWSVIKNYTILSSTGATTTYVDAGLGTNTGYYYRVKARNGNGVETAYSDTLYWKTATSAPEPIAVTATSGASDSLDVSWTAPAGATSYKIYVDGATAATGVTGTSGTYDGFAPNTPHDVSVKANNAWGDSPASGIVTRYTLAEVPSVAFGTVTTDSMLLGILNKGNAADTAYRLERSTDGENWIPMEDYTVYAGASAIYNYMVTGLNDGTLYYFRVKARNGDTIETSYSETVSKMTLPMAPTGLTVTPQEITEDVAGNQSVSLMLSWTAPTGAESYSIYRQATGETAYTKIEAAYRDGTLYMDTGLKPNVQYTYTIVAKNASGESESSGEVSAYTLAALPGISSEVSGDTINLTIGPNGNPELGSAENSVGTEYFIQYSTDAGETWTNLSDSWYNYLTPQHAGVSAGSSYQYHVKARNGDGVETDYSGTSSARTNVAPVITIAAPAENLYLSAQTGHTSFTLSGTVSDADGDSVRIYASIDGVKKSTVVSATAAGVPWSLTWDIAADGIAQSEYSAIGVSGDDGYKGYTTAYWPSTLHVDKTGPELPAVTPETTDWTNADSVSVTVAAGADAASGADYTEYKLTGATARGWTTYTGAFSITNAGETVVTARTIDKMGNIGTEQTAVVRIDRTAPEGGSLSVSATYGDTTYTRSPIVDLAISATDAGGSGDGTDPALPKTMQISNSATFAPYTEVAYAASFDDWTLSGADGEKTVYVRFVDAVGNVGEALSASIILDTTDPVVSISSPSSFNAKKGSTVTYVLTVSEDSTLAGINTGDKSNISLSTFGDFSDTDINTIKDAITVTDTDSRHRTVSIHIPETISGSEGTIGVTVLFGAATDAAGNQSALAVGNASFVIDAIAPGNQNILFPDSLTVQGGQSVTLADCSENCAGGYDSDSVRFASADLYGYTYDGGDPANGTTITSTHGRSTVINAPTQDGTYYLYVIDAAGNVSGASTAVLTVKNFGPSVSFTGPSDAYVNSGGSVSFTAVYSADAASISLSANDVALVTTGTANAYVSISDVAGDPLRKTITLYNLMGEGTVQMRIASGTALDTEGNPATASEVSAPVTVDNTPALAVDLGITSNNAANTSYAVKGNTLTLQVTADEDLQGVTGTIAGQSVTFTAVDFSATRWSAAYTIPSDGTLDSLDGEKVPFILVMTDLTGNVSENLTEDDLAENGGVTLDFTAPVITISGDTDSLGRYIGGATVTFNEGTCVVTNTASETNEIESGAVVYDEGTYTAIVTDPAGNFSTGTFTVSYGAIVLERDLDSLAIAFAEGDSADNVTRNIMLPLRSTSGSDVSWSVDSGTAVSLSGIGSASGDDYTAGVSRPDHASGDDTVVLTATITVDGVTDTKSFTLTVKTAPDNTAGLGNVQDDAENAPITYAYGDAQDSVTLDIGLGDTGLLHGSLITWESDQEDVISISEAATDGVYTGSVTQPENNDVVVRLTATATDPDDESVFATYIFDLTVKAIELTDAEKAIGDYELVSISYADGDSDSSVTKNLTFSAPVVNGSTITWSSGNTAYISHAGTVTRPAYGAGNVDVTITATIRNGSATLTKRFTVTVIGREAPTPSEALALDLDGLAVGYYGSDSAVSVTTHVVLPTAGDWGSTVSWESSDENILAADGTVTRPSDSDTDVTLTATLVNGAESTTKVFTLTIIATDNSDILQQILDDANDLGIVYTGSDSAGFVTEDLTLRTLGANGCAIDWESSDESVLSDGGEVTRSNTDTQVTLTASVQKYSDEIDYWVCRTKTFTVTVAKSDSLSVESDLDDVEVVYADGDSAGSVTSSVYLTKTGATGCQVTWTSSNTNYITAAGKVMRPDPDGSDHVVTLTATISNTLTGQTATKVFTLTVKKMTDDDAVRAAAKNLSIYDAFAFDSDTDIWESVTGGFLILTQGSYDTTISWSSGNTDVIHIGGVDPATGRLAATITRPADKDASVILTATITRGSAVVTKTFLLIVKMEGTVRATTRQAESGTEFELSSAESANGLSVYRTIASKGGSDTYIDTVIFDPDIVGQLASDIDPNGSASERTLTLTMPKTTVSGQATNEQAVEIPASAATLIDDHSTQLVIDSAFGGVTIPASTFHSLAESGTDLYFRIRPLEDAAEQTALSSAAILKLGTGTDMIGTPLTVEANYSGTTYVTIPFGSAVITDYSGLRIYVSHSDGTEEVLSGTLVYTAGSATPYGIQFSISHFSDFQIAKIPSIDDSSGTSSGSGNTTSLSKLEDLFGSGQNYTAEGEGGLKAEFGPGDINPDKLVTGLGAGSADDIDITVTLRSQDSEESERTGDILAGADLYPVGTPFVLGVSASYGGTTLEIQSFESYVDILVPLESGQRITTAVRVGADGSIIHIPTEVVILNGSYYARIHSFVTGVFALIWNPLEMDDVTAHWSKDGVNDVASRLVVFGVGNNLYAPDRDITRAEFAAILVRGLGLLRGVGSQNFPDVPDSAWYAEYIETAVSYGLIYGYGDGRFGPEDTITREQAMTMLLRAMKLTGLDGSVSESQLKMILSAFTDSYELSDYAIAAAAGCVKTGVILGVNETRTTLSPKSYISRAQAAVSVERLLQYSGLID